MTPVIGVALLYFLVLIELFIIRFKLKEPIPWKQLVLNLNSGHILMWVGRGIEVLGYNYILTHFSFGWIAAWPVALQWVFTFIIWDFCFYWLHRMHHAIPFLWGVHEVHHQGEHFSLSLGIRNSWYSSLTSLPFFIPLAIIGAPLEQFIILGSVHYFIQFYNHNRIVKKSGWLEYFMVTPAHHKVHHGKNHEYLDKNCSGTFIIWDKLFGTFQRELKNVPIEIGIHNPIQSQNPFWINNIPFVHFFGIHLKRKGYSQSSYKLNDAVIGFGGLLLFTWLLLYISVEQSWEFFKLSYLFAIIFLSTISICGLAEGKIWGVITWLIFFFMGSVIFAIIYPSLAVIIIALLNTLHVSFVIFYLLQKK